MHKLSMSALSGVRLGPLIVFSAAVKMAMPPLVLSVLWGNQGAKVLVGGTGLLLLPRVDPPRGVQFDPLRFVAHAPHHRSD